MALPGSKPNVCSNRKHRTFLKGRGITWFDPLVNMTHEAAKEDRDLKGLGPMSSGMAERIKRERSNKT